MTGCRQGRQHIVGQVAARVSCLFRHYGWAKSAPQVLSFSSKAKQKTAASELRAFILESDQNFNTTNTPHSLYRQVIRMHPQSIGQHIVSPGNMVWKYNPRTKQSKLRYTELVYGYFWPLKELRLCNDKLILTTQSDLDKPPLIPAHLAPIFPSLQQTQSLADLSSYVGPLPEYFAQHAPEGASCTLVGVSFNDYGYQLLQQWFNPFRDAFARPSVAQITISDGYLNRYLLRNVIVAAQKKHTPRDRYPHTLLSFGGTAKGATENMLPLDLWRDSLRMHNPYTCYVFLLDGLGRIRWIASGPPLQGTSTEPSLDEVQSLLTAARALTRGSATLPSSPSVTPGVDVSAARNKWHNEGGNRSKMRR
jgi:mitochondrial ATPase complex subunit ATP10